MSGRCLLVLLQCGCRVSNQRRESRWRHCRGPPSLRLLCLRLSKVLQLLQERPGRPGPGRYRRCARPAAWAGAHIDGPHREQVRILHAAGGRATDCSQWTTATSRTATRTASTVHAATAAATTDQTTAATDAADEAAARCPRYPGSPERTTCGQSSTRRHIYTCGILYVRFPVLHVVLLCWWHAALYKYTKHFSCLSGAACASHDSSHFPCCAPLQAPRTSSKSSRTYLPSSGWKHLATWRTSLTLSLHQRG